MQHRLKFSKSIGYHSADGGIQVPITLRTHRTEVDLEAYIDTGASHCLFEQDVAHQLGLDVTDGISMRFRTAKSGFEAFGHEVEIELLGVRTHSVAYFFADAEIRKNVLGRTGWLDRVRLGIVDYDRMLYLAEYNEQ